MVTIGPERPEDFEAARAVHERAFGASARVPRAVVTGFRRYSGAR
jgi:predicted N-acetyltransferase YhbS